MIHFSMISLQDLYVYISESDREPDYDRDLVWNELGIIYGDWTGGPQKDSSYELKTRIIPSDVSSLSLASFMTV